MGKEIEKIKIYILRINSRAQSYHKTLDIAKNKLKEKKHFYIGRHCEILKDSETSFEAFLEGWNSIHNYIDIKEIELED